MLLKPIPEIKGASHRRASFRLKGARVEKNEIVDRLAAGPRRIGINRDCVVRSNTLDRAESFAVLIIPGSSRPCNRRGQSHRGQKLLGISEFFRRLANQDTFLSAARMSGLIKSPLTKLISEIRLGEWVTTTSQRRIVSLFGKLARFYARFCFSICRRWQKTTRRPIRV